MTTMAKPRLLHQCDMKLASAQLGDDAWEEWLYLCNRLDGLMAGLDLLHDNAVEAALAFAVSCCHRMIFWMLVYEAPQFSLEDIAQDLRIDKFSTEAILRPLVTDGRAKVNELGLYALAWNEPLQI